jgi:hypothetical protein
MGGRLARQGMMARGSLLAIPSPSSFYALPFSPRREARHH